MWLTLYFDRIAALTDAFYVVILRHLPSSNLVDFLHVLGTGCKHFRSKCVGMPSPVRPQMRESVQPLLPEFPVGREDLESITK